MQRLWLRKRHYVIKTRSLGWVKWETISSYFFFSVHRKYLLHVIGRIMTSWYCGITQDSAISGAFTWEHCQLMCGYFLNIHQHHCFWESRNPIKPKRKLQFQKPSCSFSYLCRLVKKYLLDFPEPYFLWRLWRFDRIVELQYFKTCSFFLFYQECGHACL